MSGEEKALRLRTNYVPTTRAKNLRKKDDWCLQNLTLQIGKSDKSENKGKFTTIEKMKRWVSKKREERRTKVGDLTPKKIGKERMSKE
jgi:hypothetical protein